MTYEAFREAAAGMVDEIPEAFLKGLQGVHVLEEAREEEDYEDVYRLGEYLDPGTEDFLGGQPGLGRHIALYYGSFVAVAEGDPTFDWEGELWETITHELRHHVESLAGEDLLVQDDVERQKDFLRRND
jgi:hypothetical protein